MGSLVKSKSYNIYKIHVRALKIAYKGNVSSFENLFKIDAVKAMLSPNLHKVPPF